MKPFGLKEEERSPRLALPEESKAKLAVITAKQALDS